MNYAIIILRKNVIIIKKVVLFVIALLFFYNCNALNIENNKIKVKLKGCVDGDTANFYYQNEVIKVRLLAIDSPELEHEEQKEEPFAMEAKNYTCSKLKKAEKIYLEFDLKSNKQDKYDRYLAWIFVDDELLQEKIVENGYAKVAYLYDDYKYTDKLLRSNTKAQNDKKGIYSDVNYEKNNILTKIKNMLQNIVKKFIGFRVFD